MNNQESRKTEFVSARYTDLHSWNSIDILEALLESQLTAIAAVRSALPAMAIAAEDAVAGLSNGGRLVYVGAGTSGRIGFQDGAELTPTFNWATDRLILLLAGGQAALSGAVENAEDDEEQAIAAIIEHNVGLNDVVIGVAASGTTPYTVASLHEARRREALTIAVANNPDTPIFLSASHRILIETGAEAVAGSTRLKAGTAQKAVLNLLSTLMMVKLGRVWRGQMVDMRITNGKLRNRAERMLASLTGADTSSVQGALEAAHGSVKIALVILSGVSPRHAPRLLAKHNGFLDPTLAEAVLGGATEDLM